MGLRLGIGGEKKRNGTGGKAARSRLSGGHVVVCLVSFGAWWIWDRGIRNTFRNIGVLVRFLEGWSFLSLADSFDEGGARAPSRMVSFFLRGVVFPQVP